MVKLDHINISVENLSESINWYEDIFNFKVVEEGEYKGTPYGIIKVNESMICMYQYPNKEKPETNKEHKVFHFGLRVEDPKLWEKKLDECGIKPHLVWDYPHSKSWYLHDPTGHEIEVCYWNNNEIKFQELRF